MRDLAERAGTPASTVARIESGSTDPTCGMLSRLLHAAGYSLEPRIAPLARRQPGQLRNLTDAWTSAAGGDQPDWTRLRVFLDILAQHPEDIPFAIRRPPGRSGSPLLDALLAAVADKLADDHQLPRPPWTAAQTRRLSPIWQPAGTPAMQQRTQAAAPRQFLEHGLVLSDDSLFRRRERVHA